MEEQTCKPHHWVYSDTIFCSKKKQCIVRDMNETQTADDNGDKPFSVAPKACAQRIGFKVATLFNIMAG